APTARPVPDPLSSRRKRNNLAHRGERQAWEAGLPYRVKKRTCFSLQNVSKAVLFRRVFETFALYVATYQLSRTTLTARRQPSAEPPWRRRPRARGVSFENLWDWSRGRSARKSCG